jgi:flagellar biogenesis protein FliO
LVLAVAGIGGAAIYAKRSKRITGKFPQSARLRVMSSVRVGPKGFLVLAGVGERTLLLGVTDDSVRRIAWMANEPADSAAQSPNGEHVGAALVPAPRPPFKEFLRGLRASSDDASSDSSDSSPALRLAAENRDDVQWSPEAKTTRQPALGTARTQPDLGTLSVSIEQQAAGIMKRKARRRV